MKPVPVVVSKSALLIPVIFALAMLQPYGAWGVFCGLGVGAAFWLLIWMHEAGHVLAAHFLGYRAKCIRIGGWGGLTEFEVAPRRARDEFLISAAGPAVNLLAAAIAGVLWHAALRTQQSEPAAFLGVWAKLNLVLGLFNLLPIMPMDGAACCGPFTPTGARPSGRRPPCPTSLRWAGGFLRWSGAECSSTGTERALCFSC